MYVIVAEKSFPQKKILKRYPLLGRYVPSFTKINKMLIEKVRL